MGRGPSLDYDLIRATYEGAPGKTRSARVRHVMAVIGCSAPTVNRAIVGKRTTTSSSQIRHGQVGERSATVLPVGHPATTEFRTVFPSMVLEVGHELVLKSGEHSAKIGRRITKGAWRGFPIYTLTLEERATCPTTCRHWASCYGNNSNYSRRWRHGPALELRLRGEIAALARDNPAGFAIRLHNLGDFYSTGYVALWREMLEKHPGLHVFGYTARIDPDDVVCQHLALLVRDYWAKAEHPRFCLRFSNADIPLRATVSLESPVQRPRDAVICPAQWTSSGKRTESCSTCGLCWGTARRIAFLQH